MKIIKQVKLFFKEGNSDKVYEIDLCEINSNDYIVNFRYGRRGSVLKEGTKTPSYVSLSKAEDIFAELDAEKRKKGYQSEFEVFVELPSIESFNPKSLEGSILKRLEDATQGINSFKSEWKTSRVIWRAGKLGFMDAIPFILKLATKGDEMQLYASVYALLKLKAANAVELLQNIAGSNRQKDYIRHLAAEALLTIASGVELEKVIADLLDQMPPEVKYYIEKGDYMALQAALQDKFNKNERTTFLHIIYLISKQYDSLHTVVHHFLVQVPFEPPYFKSIRAIYKLAKYRDDHQTIALLAYLFEKKDPMFTRTVSLSKEASSNNQYINFLSQKVNLRKELQSKESRIAYSQFTKLYFQKDIINHLKFFGESKNAKDYLKLVVNILMNFDEQDYSPAQTAPLSYYGSYDYDAKKYFYTVVTYSECSNSFLLSSILFGNDTNRFLTSNLQSYTNKETYASNEYYYNPANVIKTKINPKTENTTAGSVIGSIVNTFKSFWSKPKVEVKPKEEPKEEIPEVPIAEVNPRLELFPELWDTFPQAYIQLLMLAKMNRIHSFAFTNVKNHPSYQELKNQLRSDDILALLNRPFAIPNEFGFEALNQRENEFYMHEVFVANVLASNHSPARTWAKEKIENNNSHFLKSLDFTMLIVLNPLEDTREFIDSFIAKGGYSEDQLKAILGKIIIELLSFENTEFNHRKVKIATARIVSIGANQLHEISWEIVAQMITSSVSSNTLLASEILILKAKKSSPTEIPFAIIDLLLKENDEYIRQNGIKLLVQYPLENLAVHWDTLIQHIDTEYKDVLDAIRQLNLKLTAGYQNCVQATLVSLVYALLKKEPFEGAFERYKNTLLIDCKDFVQNIPRKLIVKLIYAHQRESQLVGYELLKAIEDPHSFSIKQIVSLANHEILAIRQWVWNFFKTNTSRIKHERSLALGLLDSKWEDSRAFAFHYFKTEFTESDWDAECLIGIVDSVRPDVEKFGKDLIMTFFKKEQGPYYLTQLSQHPSLSIQMFVVHYLEEYASNQPHKLEELSFYFRSVLTRVNRARNTKNQIFEFLAREGKKSEHAARVVSAIVDDIAATTAIQDKAKCVAILTELKQLYPDLSLHLHLIA